MSESRYAGPRRTPVLDHAAVIKAVIEWFQNKSQWRAAEIEMQLPMPEHRWRERQPKLRRADVIAFNPTDHEFYIIEVKAQWNDFVRDRKFFDYRKWCNWFAFAVPEELAACARWRMDDNPRRYEGVGLLVIPNDYIDRRMVRRPTKHEMSEETYRSMTERWGLSCWGRLIDTRRRIAELEWRLENTESDVSQLKKKLGDSNPTLYP